MILAQAWRIVTVLSTTWTAWSFFLIASFTVSCGPQSGQETYDLQGFVADYNTQNHLLLFVGDDTNIPGVRQDPDNMKSLFNENSIFRMKVHNPGGPNPVSKELILSTISDVAQQASPTSTMMIYLTSHGMSGGLTLTQTGTLESQEILDAIARARPKNQKGEPIPLERLIIMFDTCYSGSNARAISAKNYSPSGSNSLNQNNNEPGILGQFSLANRSQTPTVGELNQQALKGQKDPKILSQQNVNKALKALDGKRNNYGGIYRSLIFISASRADETSADLSEGGAGTLSFIRAVREALGQQDSNLAPNTGDNGLEALFSSRQSSEFESTSANAGSHKATNRAILDRMRSYAQVFGQTPVWCMEPAALADDFFLMPPKGFLPKRLDNASGEALGNRICSENF